MEIVFVLILAALLPVYIKAEYETKFFKATVLKLILTFMAITITITSLIIRDISVYTWLVLIALIFAFIGDYFLQFININAVKYNIGIIMFSICQIILLTCIIFWYGFVWWGLFFTVVLVIICSFVVKPLKVELGINKIPLLLYSFLLSLVAGQSFAAFIINGSLTAGLLFFGTLLFAVSDIFLGYWKYQNTKWRYAFMCWVCYFYGLALIALSTHWL